MIIPSKKDITCLFLFMFLWIIPFLYYGITNKPVPGLPTFLAYLHNSSSLFTHRVEAWPQYFVQIQFEKNGPWFLYTDYAADFKMQPFGYRNRLNRFFEIYADKRWKKGREELALWLRENYKKHFPQKEAPIAIRFINTYQSLRNKGNFNGHWRNLPFEAFAAESRFITSTHTFVEPEGKIHSQ